MLGLVDPIAPLLPIFQDFLQIRLMHKLLRYFIDRKILISDLVLKPFFKLTKLVVKGMSFLHTAIHINFLLLNHTPHILNSSLKAPLPFIIAGCVFKTAGYYMLQSPAF